MRNTYYMTSRAGSIKESRNDKTLKKSFTPHDKNDQKPEFILEPKDGEFQISLSELSDRKPSYRAYRKPSVRKRTERKRSLPESSFPEPSLIGKL